VEHRPSLEANSLLASQEILHILWSPKDHYRVHKSQPILRPCETFRNKLFSYDVELAPSPNPMLEDHNLSAVLDCLLNIFTATLHIWRAVAAHSV